MPLDHLIDTFNHRFTEENHLDSPPFDFRGGQVFGRFGDLTFTSDFRPIRQLIRPDEIRAHETTPLIFSPANYSRENNRSGPDFLKSSIVSLDRLSRTVHMLNYLLLDFSEGTLFLHVHPEHILSVNSDHGAYFEEIIRACGLPLRRIAISLTLSITHAQKLNLLLERLKNYRKRGYAIAVRFDGNATAALINQFRDHHLHRLAPDHVRFPISLFSDGFEERPGERLRQRLFSSLRQQDTQVHLTEIRTLHDFDLARELAADYVEGKFLEETAASKQSLKRSA